MRTALRVIGITTTILWIFVGAFIGITVYSALRIRIEEFSGGGYFYGDKFIIRINVTIFNGGYFDITDISILTRLHMPLVGIELNRSSTFVRAIGAGERGRITHGFELDILSLLDRPEVVRAFLLNSTDLELVLSFSLTYAIVFTVAMDVNTTMPWKAFLSGFTVREYEVSPVDDEVDFILNVTFKNESELGFNFWLRAFDGSGTPIGESSPISIDAGDTFDGQVVIPIPADNWTGEGWVSACIDIGIGRPLCTEVLSYG